MEEKLNMLNRVNQMNNQFSPYGYPSMGVTAPMNNVIWVQGKEGANSWQMNPNSLAILLDSENSGKMYIKTTDNVGISSLRMFEYTEVTGSDKGESKGTVNDLDLSQFVKKDELNTFIKELIEEHERIVSRTAGVSTTEPESANTESNAAAE
jgi:hypothetical protein